MLYKRLEQEIKNVKASVVNDLEVRKAHPTYGRTKTAMRAQVNKLEGLLAAYAWTFLLDESAYVEVAALVAAKPLDVNLGDLRAQIDAS